jgi:effector-binding domain-containing protein
MNDEPDQPKEPASPTCYLGEAEIESLRVEAVDVKSTLLAAIPTRATASTLGDTIVACLNEVYTFLNAAAVRQRRHNVVVYRDDAFTIDVGVEVSASIAATGRIVCVQTPRGTAARVTFFGPYSDLSKAHSAVRLWCERNDRPFGTSWEVYGDWNDEPSKRRTDVYYLLL